MMTIDDRRRYRWLEMFPGLMAWSTLLLAVVLSFIMPLAAMIFIVLFDLLWLIRVVYVMIFTIAAYRQYHLAQQLDWRAKRQQHVDWPSIVHLIFLPTYGESLEVLSSTLTSLARVDYPADRFYVILAIEEREGEVAQQKAKALQAQFADKFGYFFISQHPGNIAGEIAGKGSNIAWAGRQIKSIIDQRGLPYKNILVSTFDADSNVHPQYFNALTATFLSHPRRWRTSYQPIPVFHNNIWTSFSFMRVVAYSTTFWLLGETLRPDRLLTFSSHSMPWQALVDVNFWQNDIVSEDSRIFLQCFVHYDGDYSVQPIFLPISMDTVHGGTLWRSLTNQYKQIRRWAYGVENFPYMVWNFLPNPKIPRWRKWQLIWNQFEGTYSWSTAAILIFILGWLPFHVPSVVKSSSLLALNAPVLLQIMMGLAMVGLITSAAISSLMLPPRPVRISAGKHLMMLLQWVLLPVTMIAFGSLPALEAQTRLMLGKYMGFWVTEKKRQ